MAKRIIITALLACLILGTAAAQNARQHIAQGQEHMRAENFAEAVASFEAALRVEPRNRQAPPLLREAQEKRMQQTFVQAQALHQEGNFTEAITQYNLAIRYAPPGHNTRNIQNRREEAQRALAEHEQQAQEMAALSRTEQARQTMQRAHDLFIAGQFAEAIHSYESAISGGVINEAQITEARRLVAEVREVQTRIESFNRSLRDDDFDVTQNQTGGVTITKYKGTESRTVNIGGTNHTISYGILNVPIPQRIYGANVTNIGAGSFRNTGITSVVVPDTVTEIGAGAFAGNKLERVTLGRAVRFIRGGPVEGRAEVSEPGAFEGNAPLTNIVIPDTVTEIGARAFRDCGLTSVTLGRAVQSIGESAFRNNKLAVITFPPALRRIHRFAFHGNQIQSLSIPNGMETIWDDAFTNNPMTAVVIPPSLAQLINIGGQQCPRLGGDHVLYSAHIPSFPPDTLARVTLPANVNDRNMGGFEESLRNFYISQNRRAGTYVKNGPIWSLQ